MRKLPLLAGWLSFCYATCVPVLAIEIIGHRASASHDVPENTLASVNLSWEQDADATEIDIYLTRDRRIAVIHDKSTKRTAGKDRPVADQTMDELKLLDAGTWKNAKFAGERIPTLEEVLATIPDGKRLFIEIKCGRKVIPELERVLKASGKKAEQTPVIAFDWNVVAEVKRRLPQLKVYWIVKLKQDKESGRWQPDIDTLISEARRAMVDGVDLGDLTSVDSADVKKIKQSGLAVYCWTINDGAEAKRLMRIGFDGITTDRPGWLRERLQEKSP